MLPNQLSVFRTEIQNSWIQDYSAFIQRDMHFINLAKSTQFLGLLLTLYTNTTDSFLYTAFLLHSLWKNRKCVGNGESFKFADKIFHENLKHADIRIFYIDNEGCNLI